MVDFPFPPETRRKNRKITTKCNYILCESRVHLHLYIRIYSKYQQFFERSTAWKDCAHNLSWTEVWFILKPQNLFPHNAKTLISNPQNKTPPTVYISTRNSSMYITVALCSLLNQALDGHRIEVNRYLCIVMRSTNAQFIAMTINNYNCT